MKFSELYKMVRAGAVGYLSKELAAEARQACERKRIAVNQEREGLVKFLFRGPKGSVGLQRRLQHRRNQVLTDTRGRTTRDLGRETARLIEAECALGIRASTPWGHG